jgi:hypothetical protein
MASAQFPDEWFADSIAAPPVGVPPMPKPSGWQTFGDVLATIGGAKIDRQGNYYKGLEAGSQVKLRSAQTESALAEADKRRAETLRQSQINDLIAKAQSNPAYQPSVSDLLTIATGAADLTHGQLYQQEAAQRGTIADPKAPQPTRLANMEAVTGKPVERYYQSGTGMQASQIDPLAAPTVTPVGEANIAADMALKGQRDRNVSGGFTLGGVRYNADGTPVVDVQDIANNSAAVAEAVARARAAAKPGAGAKPLTESQMKAVGQLSRMERTEQILTSPEMTGYVPSLATAAAARVPGVGNYMVDSQYQKYAQAAREWISGLLRLDSGAAVPETEFTRYFGTFFPQPGDDDAVIAQKADARAWATANLRAGLGDAANHVTAPGEPPAAAPGTAPAVPAGVAIRKTSKSGKPIVSRDGGKTWEYE